MYTDPFTRGGPTIFLFVVGSPFCEGSINPAVQVGKSKLTWPVIVKDLVALDLSKLLT